MSNVTMTMPTEAAALLLTMLGNATLRVGDPDFHAVAEAAAAAAAALKTALEGAA
jgi:hypothetical protein